VTERLNGWGGVGFGVRVTTFFAQGYRVHLPHKVPLAVGVSRPHLMHGSLGPHESDPPPNGISIGSAVFARLKIVSNTHRQTDRRRCGLITTSCYSNGSDRPHRRHRRTVLVLLDV